MVMNEDLKALYKGILLSGLMVLKYQDEEHWTLCKPEYKQLKEVYEKDQSIEEGHNRTQRSKEEL